MIVRSGFSLVVRIYNVEFGVVQISVRFDCSVNPSVFPASTESSHDLVLQQASEFDLRVLRSKIVMVDDEPGNMKAVQKHLSGLGYENFVAVPDSTQAIDVVKQEQPDLVLLDIVMPGVNGLELLKQIRSKQQWRELPVVILTASSDPNIKRDSLAAGATDFLAKPVDRHELALRLQNVLTTKALYDEKVNRAEQLEKEIQQQAEQLANAEHQGELRYIAGKAEIATDVLHNIGNALQSVKTGASLVSYAVRESRLPLMKRAVDLFSDHEDDIASFMTQDERGKILPSYLIELCDSLLNERDQITTEIQLLEKHLEHISAVLSTQQKYAALCNVTDEFQLADLVTDVEELLSCSLANSGIEVIREFANVPSIHTDRQKLMQVVLNVVKNAIESIKLYNPAQGGRLMISVASTTGGKVSMRVADNGAGITEENRKKVFVHGFSTKRDGHGFGLHSCANIMKELGGSIEVNSSGPGQGATFSLSLPVLEEERS